MSRTPYRKEIVARIQTTIPGHFLSVYVTYDDGKGPGYDDGKVHIRCYRLHVQPITVEDKGTYEVVSFAAYTGCSALIEQVARYNEKNMKLAASNALTTDLCKRLVEIVLDNPRNNGLAIAQGQPFATEPITA